MPFASWWSAVRGDGAEGSAEAESGDATSAASGKGATADAFAAEDVLDPQRGFLSHLTASETALLERMLKDTAVMWSEPDDALRETAEASEAGLAEADSRASSTDDPPTASLSSRLSSRLSRWRCRSQLSATASPSSSVSVPPWDTWRRYGAAWHRDVLLQRARASDTERQAILLQFLRARDFHYERALSMFLDTMHWRLSLPVCAMPPDAETDARASFPFYHPPGCWNRFGHLLIYAKMAHFDARRVSRRAFYRAVVAHMERLTYGMSEAQRATRLQGTARPRPHSSERATVVFDLGDGFSPFRNADLPCLVDMISLAQNRYPERLGKVYVIHYGVYIFAFYKMLTPFMEAKTRAKVHWVRGDAATVAAVFRADFELQHLPRFLGGEVDWQAPPPPPMTDGKGDA